MEQLLTTLDDRSLVKLFQEGNNRAFDILVKRHIASVRATVKKIINGNELDDLVQEAFVKAMIAIRENNYTEDGHFKYWVISIGRNHAINFYRKKRDAKVKITSVPNIPASADEDFYFPQIADENESQEAKVIELESSSSKQLLIERLLSELSDDEKELILLRYFHGMKFIEISAYFGEEHKSTYRVKLRNLFIRIQKEQGISVDKRKLIDSSKRPKKRSGERKDVEEDEKPVQWKATIKFG